MIPKLAILPTSAYDTASEVGLWRVHTVSEILRMHRFEVSNVIRPQKAEKLSKRRGCKPLLCAHALYRLHRGIFENPFKHLSLIMAELNRCRDIKLSERTVRRYIYNMKIDCYMSVQMRF